MQVFLPEWIHSETGIGSPALFEKIVQNDSNDCHNVGAVEQLRTSDKPNQVKHKNQPESFLRLTSRKGELEGSNLSVLISTPYCFSLRIHCYASARASKSTQEQPREASLTFGFGAELFSGNTTFVRFPRLQGACGMLWLSIDSSSTCCFASTRLFRFNSFVSTSDSKNSCC